MINGRRLGVGSGALLAVGAAGLAAVTARTILAANVDLGSASRLTVGLAGVAVWLVVRLTQRGRFRAFQLTGAEPASGLWQLAAAAGADIFVEMAILDAVTGEWGL